MEHKENYKRIVSPFPTKREDKKPLLKSAYENEEDLKPENDEILKILRSVYNDENFNLDDKLKSRYGLKWKWNNLSWRLF